ncbi:hypothetical protein BGX38DRAFT_1147173 [Terfezia claveryi]|nr:hypothetical protein BGX38DRAFT_1147173 [Terfezia claveryi]
MSSSIDTTDLTTLSSTSGVSIQPSHALVPWENQRIRIIQRDTKTYPSPPPSPPRPKRTSLSSGLDSRDSSKVALKRQCTGNFELGESKLHLNDMTADSQLENGKAFSGTYRNPVGQSNGHEQVRNVGSNINPTATMVAGNGYISPGNIAPKSHTPTVNPPSHKKRRYFEVDPLTGEERITEIMDGLASARGGGEKKVYSLPCYTPLGQSHSRNGHHQIGGSASPPRSKTPLGVNEGNPRLPPMLKSRAELSTPEPVLDRKGIICESPAPMSRAVSAGIPSANGTVAHVTQTFAGGLPTQAPLTASSVSNMAGSPTNMGYAAETCITPLATNPSSPASVYVTLDNERSGIEVLPMLHVGVRPESMQRDDSSLVGPVISKPLLEECPLNEVTKEAPLSEGKKRRDPPPPLSLADDVGNFATLASSRERRQPLNTIHITSKEPILGTPGKTPTTKSVPATPVRSHSRKNSHSSHTIQVFSPDMRPLSPILPPREKYVSRVPSPVSDRIIGTHVSLYAMRNGGVHPPSGLPRRSIKGTYRLPMETDKPDLGDFIVLKHSEVAYWEGDIDAEDSRMQSGEEDETSSTDVERWSGGYVKGPKYRTRQRPKCKFGSVADVVTPASSTIPNNIPQPNLCTKPTLKVSNGPNVLSSILKGKNAGDSDGAAAVENMGLGLKWRPTRKLSSIIAEDEDALVDDHMDQDYGPRVDTSSGSRPACRDGISISSASDELSTGRHISTKYRTSTNEMSSIDIPVATASSPYPFISDTEISSDEDIIPAVSAFGHGTATTLESTKTSLAGQSREQRKQDRINAVRLTEGGPGGVGFRQGSSSIFSIVQLGVPGVGVMGPPAAKVSPAEYRLYIGRRGDQVPLFGSGGNMVVPGLGSGSLNDHIAVGGDIQHGGASVFQPGGIVEVRRVEDPLLEATMEIKRLIYENGHQGGLAPAHGVLGGLSVEKVYWSGEREASLTKPLFGIGVDFSGRPLVKALTFSNPLTNHSYTLSFVWAFLPVNTPEKNKENAVGNSMLLSDEVKGEGASSIHSDDIRASFQVHLCVGKPGRVQKKEERKRTVFVQFLNTGKGGKSSKNVLESIQWERWELDGLMRGLTRLWLERIKSWQGSKAMGLPRTLKRSFTSYNAMHFDSTEIGDSIGNWLEREVLGLESELPNKSLSSKPQAKKTKTLQDHINKLTRLPQAAPARVRIGNVQTSLPMYLQAADSRFTSPADLPPPLTPPLSPLSPRKKTLNSNIYGGAGTKSEAEGRGKHRKEILMKELSEVLPEVEDAMMASEEESEKEDVCWWW